MQIRLTFVEEDIKRIEAENEALTQENEKLQAELISYNTLNAGLQKEKESLEGIIKIREGDLQKLNQKAEQLEKQIAKERLIDKAKWIKDNKMLIAKVGSLETTLQKEVGSLGTVIKELSKESNPGVFDYMSWQIMFKEQIGKANQQLLESINKQKDLKENKALLNLLHYNMGLSYALTENFNLAINAFEEALKFNPQDANSSYNLGLLYSVCHQEDQKAGEYYKKYLSLVPSGPKNTGVPKKK